MAPEKEMPKSLTLMIPESLARKLDCMGEDLLEEDPRLNVAYGNSR